MHQFMVYDPGSEELTMTVWDEVGQCRLTL